MKMRLYLSTKMRSSIMNEKNDKLNAKILIKIPIFVIERLSHVMRRSFL